MAKLTFVHGGKVLAVLDRAKMIDALAQRLPEDLRDPFKAAADEADSKLAAFLDEKRDEILQKIPADARFLVSKLKDFDEQSFDLADYTAAKRGVPGKLTAEAGAKLRLERLDPGDLQGDAEFPLAGDEALLKLQVEGHLSGTADLKNSAAVLAAGLNFAAGTEQALSYYVAADKNAYVAELIPKLGDFLVDPSRLSAIVEAFENPLLVRVERSGDSTMHLGVTIGICEQIDRMIEGLPATGGAGASLSLEYQDAAGFSLIVDKKGRDRHVIDFRKTRKKTTSSVLKLGVDVKIVGFKNRLMERIARAIPEDTRLKELLEKLDELTSALSKDALTTKLKQALEDKWPQAKPVIGFIVGEDTADALAGKIRGELQQRIEEIVNAKVDLLNTSAEAAAQTVAAQIGDELGLTGTRRSTLEQYVGASVSDAMKSAQSKIDGEVAALIERADVAKLLRPWEFVGSSVADALDALSQNAQDVVSRTRSALAAVHARYTRFRQGILAAVKDKMQEELSISIVSDKERTLTNTRTVKFEFRQADDAAESLYRALWTGDLSNFDVLVANAASSDQKIGLEGEYLSLEKRVAKHTLNVNFFGLGFKATELFSDTVEVGIDLNGHLIVADSKAELDETRKRFGEAQTIKASWQVDYLRNEVLDAPLLIEVTLTDKKFKRGREVDAFFDPLEKIGAMRAGISNDVETTLFTGTVKAIKNAKLSINVMLRWQEWLQLVGRDLEGRTVAGAWVPDEVCTRFVHDVETLAPAYVQGCRDLMKRRGTSDLLAFLLKFGSFRFPERAAPFVGESAQGVSGIFGQSWWFAKAVADLHSGLAALQANWTTLVSNLPGSRKIDDEQLADLRVKMQAVNEAFGHAFERALSTGAVLDDPGKNSSMTAATLHLFTSMSELPNPYLSCTFESARTGKLLFS